MALDAPLFRQEGKHFAFLYTRFTREAKYFADELSRPPEERRRRDDEGGGGELGRRSAEARADEGHLAQL